MSDRKEMFKGTTPAGEFRYPKLNKYDEYKDKKSFKVDLVLDEDEAEALRKQLADVIAEARELGEAEFAKLKPAQKKKMGGEHTFNEVGTEEYDDDEEETGRIIFKFKTNAFTQAGRLKKISMFSASGKRLKNVQVWGGTVGKVSFSANPYFNNSNGQAGVTLYLNAVQILELVSGGAGHSAEDHGFGAVDGYNDVEDGDPEDTEAETDGDSEDSTVEDNPDF